MEKYYQDLPNKEVEKELVDFILNFDQQFVDINSINAIIADFKCSFPLLYAYTDCLLNDTEKDANSDKIAYNKKTVCTAKMQGIIFGALFAKKAMRLKTPSTTKLQ